MEVTASAGTRYSSASRIWLFPFRPLGPVEHERLRLDQARGEACGDRAGDFGEKEALAGPEALREHALVGTESSSHLPTRWLRELAPEAELSFTSEHPDLPIHAIVAGLGIGFVPVRVAEAHPDLVEVLPPRPGWDIPFWLVTHLDLHWTAKVQAMLGALREVGD